MTELHVYANWFLGNTNLKKWWGVEAECNLNLKKHLLDIFYRLPALAPVPVLISPLAESVPFWRRSCSLNFLGCR